MITDCFKSLDGREKSQLFNSFRRKSKEKRGGADKVDEDEKAVFALMSGEPDGTYGGFREIYDNLYLPAWKSFAPKYASKTPCPSVKALMEFRKALARAFQALFRYRIGTFNYRDLISAACMDVWSSKLGIGYVRHQWDAGKGLTVTSRIGPRDVFWDYSANSIAKAQHVIERHTVKRYEFARKFGKKLAEDVEAKDDCAVDWPSKDGKDAKGKTPLDEIEYFLMWSKEGGHKRVYAFHENDKLELLNGEDGEPWPITLADEDWHITDLRLTKVPGRISGISPIWAADGQHMAYQRLNASTFFSNLKAAKVIMAFPEELEPFMAKIEQAGKTFNPVPYARHEVGDKPIDQVIDKWEMPQTPETLIASRMEALNKWRGTLGLNAVQMLEAQNLETATEAQTLQSSAANMIADDQGAVEAFTVEIFRKEATCDASKMPTRSVVCWTPPGAQKKPQGEFEDEPDDYEKEPDENLIPDVPYEDAVRLETGVVSKYAGKAVEEIREQKAGEAEFDAVLSGAEDDEVKEAREQAAGMVPQTPEMQARFQYGIPVDAEVRIVNPGVEQFVGAEAAQGWVEGLTPRQIKAELGFTIEPGSSSPMQRMQAVNEVLMLLNAEAPILMQTGQYDVLAKLLTAAIRKSEIAELDDVEITGETIMQYMQQQQQQAQEAAAAEAQAKQPSGEDPKIVEMQTQAEMAKAAASNKASDSKVAVAQLKNEGDAARERVRSQSQLQMGGALP